MSNFNNWLQCLIISIILTVLVCIWLSSFTNALSYDELLAYTKDPELSQAIDTNCKSDACKMRAAAIDKAEWSNHANGVYLWMLPKNFKSADDAMKHRARVYHTKRYTNKNPQQRITRSWYCKNERHGKVLIKWCPNRVKNVQAWLDQLWRKHAIDDWLVSDYQPLEEKDNAQRKEKKICRLLRKGKSKSTNILVDDGKNNWFIDQTVDNKTWIAKIYKCINY